MYAFITMQMIEALHREKESNRKFREYVDHITLRILDKHPEILEVTPRQS